MNYRKCTIYFVALIVMVMLTSAVYGDTTLVALKSNNKVPQKTAKENVEAGKVITDEMQVMQGCPWQTERCNAFNRNRSEFKGPGAGKLISMTIDLGEVFNLTGGTLFQSIRVGRGGWVYIFCVSNGKHLLYRFNTITREHSLIGNEQYVNYRVWEGQALGPFGNLFRIGEDGTAYCQKRDGSIRWQIEAGGVPDAKLATVGNLVYLRCKNSTGEFLKVYNRDGSFAWSSGYGKFNYAWLAAEDPSSNIYIPIEGWSMMKVGPDGSTKWKVDIPDEGVTYNYGLPVIYGNDGRVCMNLRWASMPYRSPYFVLNPDGSIYKSGFFPQGSEIVDVSYGGDGRIYEIGVNDTISCFQDWDVGVWSKKVPSHVQEGVIVTLLKMVMDKDNILYVLQMDWDNGALFKLHVVKPDGQMMSPRQFPLPGDASEIVHMAIGDANNLLVLNQSGYLTIFSQGIDKSTLKKMQIRQKVVKPPKIR